MAAIAIDTQSLPALTNAPTSAATSMPASPSGSGSEARPEPVIANEADGEHEAMKEEIKEGIQQEGESDPAVSMPPTAPSHQPLT